MNLAIFLPNWVGDLVMATPTLRAVRRHFGPSARIVGILRPQLAELLHGSDWLDEQFPFDPKSGRREHGRLALIGRMRRQRFDMALLLTNSLHTAALAWLGGARQRVGYARDGRSLLSDQAGPPRPATGRRLPAGADGRKLPGPGPGDRLPGGVAAVGTERHCGRKRAGRRGCGAIWDCGPMGGSWP